MNYKKIKYFQNFFATLRMQNTERKRGVPGIGSLIREIKQMTENIQNIDDEIKAKLNEISRINQKIRDNSPKGELQARFKKLCDEVKKVKAERATKSAQHISLKNTLSVKINEVNKELGSGPIKTVDEIDNLISKYNLKLIVESFSPQNEKEISKKIEKLRLDKMRLEGSESKTKEIAALKEEIDVCKNIIKELNRVITEKNQEIDKIKAELDALVGENSKPKEVVNLENEISALRVNKQGIINSRNTKREKVKAAEAEFEKFREQFLEQKKLEEKKEAIRDQISKYEEEKEMLSKDVSGNDPKIFDSISFKVSKIKETKNFELDIALVELLMKYEIKIPTNEKDVDEALKSIKDKQSNFDEVFKNSNKHVEAKINELNEKIKKEKAKLTNLQETDFEILKKGARLRI